MKVERIILTLDEMKENSVSEEVKIVWLNEVEGRVECEIRGKKPEEFVPLTSGEDTLSLPEPYSRAYLLYLCAMIAFAKGEYELYSKGIIDYETAFSEYARYYIRSR